MKIIKRDGTKENVKFDKITSRIKKQTYELDRVFVDAHGVAKKVIEGVYDGVSSEELDTLAAETAASMVSTHYDYSYLASRLAITSLYKSRYIKKKFSDSIIELYNYINPKTGEKAGMISDEVYYFIMENKDILDAELVSDRDFLIDYFGFKTLQRSYLLKIDGNTAETPQQMWMRVACGIHYGDIKMVLKTYDLMSQKYYTHATPTLFNSGTKRPQMSSCFLIDIKDDSIKGIYDTLGDCADISQSAGGIGLSIHKIRGKGAYIKGTNGTSNGIIPMLRTFNETARYVDQGGGKRKGSIAVYLEISHSDIEDFLDLRKQHGKEELRCRDLFTALWIPDLFFKRVQNDEEWTLFSPDEAPGLNEVYGEEYEKLYVKYEQEGKGRKTIKAKALLEKIQTSQIETGTPYMLAKDAANEKSNQKNLGVIQSSNLCTEIMEYTSPEETAVCNLASIALPMFVDKGEFNHQELYEVTYHATLSLNRVIDINFYPTPETKTSNFKHRPIGLGVQGLADVFAKMGFAFTSDEAKKLNKEIFETIYFAAMTASNDLAKKDGAYESFDGSPLSKGMFQFDMWEERDVQLVDVEINGTIEKQFKIVGSKKVEHSGRWDWEKLRKSVMKHGVRNSLLVAPMPTASTSQILGNTECFEPFKSNISKRNTLSGEFVIVNKYLVNDLIKLNLWDENIKKEIIYYNGSVQYIERIPQEIRDKYKTAYEIKQKDLIDMSADRGVCVDQSQSFNIFMDKATKNKLGSVHMYGWLKGLKTLSYYIRTMPLTEANKSLGGINETKINEPEPTQEEVLACSIEAMRNGEECELCSS